MAAQPPACPFLIAKGTHLSWGLSTDKLLVDAPGLLGPFWSTLGPLVILTCHPELQVLLTEFRLQEAAETGQSIWQGGDGVEEG